MTRRPFLAFLATFVLLGSWLHGRAAADGYKVIVHPSNPTTSMSRTTVSAMLLKKQTSWKNGNKALPIDLRATSGTRDAFSRAIHGRSAGAIKKWWNQQIFSGKGMPPPEVDGDAKVIGFVLSNPGAIGYVSAETPTGDARVVVVTE
jgi:ABC-type phosphate transport system substrate-binding protein